MRPRVYRTVNDLSGFSVKSCAAMPEPAGVLMCPPDHYDVVDVKNPFMASHVGKVDRPLARRQWEALREAFEAAGKPVCLIDPVPGLEDMVFCANQTLVGLTPALEKICMPSQMRHSSRRREVPAFEAWFRERGYGIARLKDPSACFEGAGDALWHPGRRLLWGGHGFRSQPEVYEEVAAAFGTPVVLLKLVNERFYHLETCFCPLSPEAVMIYPSAFDAASLELILKLFPVVLPLSEPEAAARMACNASLAGAGTAILPRGAGGAARRLEGLGLKVVEADTSEFLKSGGAVGCLKMFLY